MRSRLAFATAALALVTLAAPHARAQASALPSAAAGGDSTEDRGHQLLDQMIAALGGDAWLHRSTWVLYGQTSHFYKGAPDPYVTGFEEYYRAQPFTERVLSVSHFSTIPGLPGKNHRDVAAIWTADNGYEVTFKGKKELPKDEVAEYQNVRRHSLDAVVLDWLKRPGTLVSYTGTGTVERRLSDDLVITTASDDTVTLKLDEGTHLPLALSFKLRNETYHDFDSESIEYETYQPFQGIMTPLSVTRYKNGDIVSQRFLTRAEYAPTLPPDFFNPDSKAVPDPKKK